jgi:glycosyltransferase involved in cell wall biosynthesis
MTTPTNRADVSAIIPLYNGGAYVLDAIASIVDQTVLPNEVIVIDDGSTDDGAKLLAGLDLPFDITVLDQDRGGQSAARNRGAAAATSRHLAFLDQDDSWLPDHLELLVRAMERSQRLGWVYGDFDEIDGKGQTVTKRFLREAQVPNPKTSLAFCLSRDLMVIPSASLLRREMFLHVGGFDESLSGYEDDDLFIRMFRAGFDHHYIDRTVTRFRIHAGSSSDDSRFIASRVLFGRKLRATIEDDVRFQRFYYRDVVVPRLFQQSLDDYVRYTSQGNWARAEVARDAMNEFAAQRADFRRKRWKLQLMQDPHRLRRLLAVESHLPGRLRVSRNPAMRLR